MTYDISADVKPEMGDANGDYVRLAYADEPELEGFGRLQPESPSNGCSLCWWMKGVLLCLFVVVGAACFFIWGGPFLINKVMKTAFQFGVSHPPQWQWMLLTSPELNMKI